MPLFEENSVQKRYCQTISELQFQESGLAGAGDRVGFSQCGTPGKAAALSFVLEGDLA
jgi:hypothetical protein